MGNEGTKDRKERGDGMGGVKSIHDVQQSSSLPVFRRPILNPMLFRVFARPIAGWSPSRPAGYVSSPILIIPLRKVPVVMTTAPAL